MFERLTPGDRRQLAVMLSQASLDTLTEAAAAVKLGQAAFDRTYGAGLAMSYVNMAHEQAMTLVDLICVDSTITQ